MSVETPPFHMRRLRLDDEAAVLAFELENRAYFARFISDRGDEFFEHFADHHRLAVADQDAGVCIFHLLLDADGRILGRVNLYDVQAGQAVIGYRLAERAAGRGVATAAVRRVAELARTEYRLATLVALVEDVNVASQKVLVNAGFAVVGATEIKGRPARRYEWSLDPLAGL